MSHQKAQALAKRLGVSLNLEAEGFEWVLRATAPEGFNFDEDVHEMVEAINQGPWGKADLWAAMAERLEGVKVVKCGPGTCPLWLSDDTCEWWG
jgi:hypothetical protein